MISIYIVLFCRSSKPALQLCTGLNPPQLEKGSTCSTVTYLVTDIFVFFSFANTSASKGHLENKPSMLREGSKGWGFVSVKLFKEKKNAVKQSKAYYITSCL